MNNFNYQLAKENLIKKKNLNKVKEFLEECSKAYYNSDSVIITDIQYDELYKKYKELTGETIIGAEAPEGTKTVSVQHAYDNLVGTLDKAKNLEEVKPFLSRFNKLNLTKEIKMRLSLKFDGNSVTIEYDENGNPKKALTRGQDGLGKDIISIFKNDKINMNGFNLSNINSEFAIKYEIIITYENYEKLCEETGVSFANPRSTVSGILNRNDGNKFRKYLTMVPLEMRVKDDGFKFTKGYKETYEAEIKEAFKDNYYIQYCREISVNNFNDALKHITKYYNEVNTKRLSLPFMIDGIVVEFLNKELIKEFFYDPTGFIPRYSFAVKLPYLEHITEVTDIDYCVGNTGRITPRIWFKPVTFNGTKHSKQQISNYKRFNELKLGKGSKIMVSYHNDCLSYITKVNEQPKGIKPFQFIKNCPICKKPIKIIINDKNEMTLATCTNDNCQSRIIGKIENYFIKMNIKGIKVNTINTLYNEGLVKDITSFYTMDYNKVAEVIGPKVAANIKNAIESKKYFDYEILGSLSIQNFSIESAKIICKKYTLKEIVGLYNTKNLYKAICDIDGFEDTTAKYIVEGIKNNSSLIMFLAKRGFKNYKDEFSNNSTSMNIAVTGWRPTPAMSLQLEKLGIVVKSSVSKKVDLLVVSGSGGDTKINKAKELGIKTMLLDDFKNKYKLN